MLIIGISLLVTMVSYDHFVDKANAQNNTNQFSLLRIIVQVNGGNASPSDFIIHLYNNTHPNKFTYAFQGPEEGIIISLQRELYYWCC